METSYQPLQTEEPNLVEDKVDSQTTLSNFHDKSTTTPSKDHGKQSSDVDSSSDDEVKTAAEKTSQTSSPQNASVWKSVSNILNIIEGVGFLALPFALKNGGIATLVSFLLIPIASCYAGNILVESLYDNDKKRGRVRVRSNFKELGDVLSPKYGGYLALAAQELGLVSIAISYLVVCGSLFSHAFSSVPLTEAMWTGIAGIIVLPTTFFKSLSEIAWLSFVSVVSLTGVVVADVWYGAGHVDQWNLQSLLFWDTEGVILSFSILVYGYASYTILPPIEGSMADKSKFGRALSIAYVMNMALKVVFSVFAFLSFGNATDEVVINNFPAGPVRIIVSMIFVFSCLLSYALALHPILGRLHQTQLVQNISAKLPGLCVYTATRVTAVLITVLLAVLLPHLALILSFTGSLVVSIGSFILPGMVHLKLKYHELKSYQILIDVFLAVFGVILCVVGVVVSGKALFETL